MTGIVTWKTLCRVVLAGHAWQPLWSNISQLVVKSLLAVAPHLRSSYRTALPHNSTTNAAAAAAASSTSSSSNKGGKLGSGALAALAGSRCFEVLGYDVLLDAELKPWLIEVNHSPSFNMDSALDRRVKEELIVDAIKVVSDHSGCRGEGELVAWGLESRKGALVL